jgi:hypothetical protein
MIVLDGKVISREGGIEDDGYGLDSLRAEEGFVEKIDIFEGKRLLRDEFRRSIGEGLFPAGRDMGVAIVKAADSVSAEEIDEPPIDGF